MVFCRFVAVGGGAHDERVVAVSEVELNLAGLLVVTFFIDRISAGIEDGEAGADHEIAVLIEGSDGHREGFGLGGLAGELEGGILAALDRYLLLLLVELVAVRYGGLAGGVIAERPIGGVFQTEDEPAERLPVFREGPGLPIDRLELLTLQADRTG